MLEINKIKHDPKHVVTNLKKRGIDVNEDIDNILELNKQRIKNQKQLDTLLNEGNQIAQMIPKMVKENKTNEIKTLKGRAGVIKNKSKKLIDFGKKIAEEIKDRLITIPNIPHASVPEGTSDQDNLIVSEWGEDLELNDDLRPHWELAEKYDIIDFKKGAQITGSGFPVYKGFGAKLQRGLINFFLDYNSDAGYHEYIPPYFINEKSAFNTGQIPDKEGMMYHINQDQLYAIPTAEVPITNIFSNSRFNENQLPIKCTAYSPCFRREAGSYGKGVRGLNRLHQFDKVEIVEICSPNKSYEILKSMIEHVSRLLKKLELKFRIIQLCGGDLGFTAAITYDFEVYSPAQKKWLEVSSVSNFETYQANRLNLKCVKKDKKTVLCHTLNGSSLALPRVMAAILEQNQTKEGIIIPKILSKYLNFDKITI